MSKYYYRFSAAKVRFLFGTTLVKIFQNTEFSDEMEGN